MESTTGNLVPYLDILCRMLIKVAFDVFAHWTAEVEVSPS